MTLPVDECPCLPPPPAGSVCNVCMVFDYHTHLLLHSHHHTTHTPGNTPMQLLTPSLQPGN